MEKNNDLLNFEGAPYAPNSIKFCLQGTEEILKLSKEGFFYKGKLIEEDKEIYLRFKEWMDNAYAVSSTGVKKSEPQKFNNIEEYQNLVGMLKKALEFYANKNNYKKPVEFSKYPVLSMIDLDEHGSQARFALKKIQEAEKFQKEFETATSNFTDANGIAYTEEEIQHLKRMEDNLKNSSLFK